jgi:hypothetical protein
MYRIAYPSESINAPQDIQELQFLGACSEPSGISLGAMQHTILREMLLIVPFLIQKHIQPMTILVLHLH